GRRVGRRGRRGRPAARRVTRLRPSSQASARVIEPCFAISITLVEKDRRMAFRGQVDFLEPINLAVHLDKVELYLGQVCQMAGISKMQLDYWTNKAQIPTKGKKQRIYDMDALETVMLIKQAKDKGLNLGAAIEAARRFREQDAVLA